MSDELPDFKKRRYGLLAMFFLYAVGLCLYLWASTASAEGFDFVHARGKLSATEPEARQILSITQAVWARELGRPLNIKSWQSRRNPFQRHHKGLGGRATVMWLWDQYGHRTRRTPIVALVPPFEELGNFYLAGMAEECGSVAFAVAEPRNQFGDDRTVHSAITAAHEIGHLAGATHDNKLPVSIMNEAVIPYSSAALKFSEKSKKEITKCRR